MNSIEAILGLSPPDDPNNTANMQGVADSLRGQQTLGNYFAGSGIDQLQKQGQRMQVGAAQQARDVASNQQHLQKAMELKKQRQINNDRNTMLDARSGVTHQNALEDRTLKLALDQQQRTRDAEDRSNLSLATEGSDRYTDENGNVVVVGVNAQGRPIDINTRQEVDTSKLTPAPTIDQQTAMDKEANRLAQEKAEIAAEEETQSKAVNDAYMSASASRRNTLISMLDAVREGATTHPMLTNLGWDAEDTALWKAGVSALTLVELPKHKLAPMSDKDMAVVKEATVPEMGNKASEGWVQHQLEVLERSDKAVALYDEVMAANNGKLTPQQQKDLNTAQERILYGEGGKESPDFDYAFKLSKANKGDYAPQTKNTGRMQGNNQKAPEVEKPKRPAFASQADWDNLTEEQQIELAK